MPTLRRATPDDAPTITAQRHQMFADNELAPEAAYNTMDLAFEPWVRERLADGRYVGLFFEEGTTLLAACGIFSAIFPRTSSIPTPSAPTSSTSTPPPQPEAAVSRPNSSNTRSTNARKPKSASSPSTPQNSANPSTKNSASPKTTK
jgi:hypothetical protein